MEDAKPWFKFCLLAAIVSSLILCIVSWIIDSYPTGTVPNTYLIFELSTTVIAGAFSLATLMFGGMGYSEEFLKLFEI
ncbi:hypothetical protein Metho_2646 (plasmid) [Methanomethylovorans hollandica DSM 15978]|uniref:Uncharacterized protein n=1 Tax=Methanomethylovorans hollandica (strain DSM 15978 / NBRC 107637 / DMS1) TaxID=867904 RepID=L0L0A9_METHD|nr:hypothetical protein [Methanomethylovorans hollandica]AGB50776.1 hypothetical protein Metho_2646 [Methanomethylovorans hollandica DSM 15978]